MGKANYENAYSIKVITAPSVEPVTVEEVKTHTRISGSSEDSLIARLIKSGRELAEMYQRRAFIKQKIEVHFDCFPLTPFCLPRSPISSIVEMKYYDTASTAVIVYSSTAPVGTENNYLVDMKSEPGRITLAYGYTWPTNMLREIDAFVVTYYAGYGETAADVPENVKDAILLYCDWRYENRSAETNEVPQQFWDLLEPGRLYL